MFLQKVLVKLLISESSTSIQKVNTSSNYYCTTTIHSEIDRLMHFYYKEKNSTIDYVTAAEAINSPTVSTFIK